ncbi:flagellar hook-associated protein FlgK [Alkalimarinus sediminis]|uniref:Flagellar hook-associated protein 1 n=1 Tax=Alkalimarinus sediminis TaxID=1632866 RepID=A0A9E8HST4_9ALTE|nr:flagellar hook-associated protein FlgK [Alkalimarinus sediminis]UZW75881.1 flagellar hook-associated protein FlgK [Alkalimarinus sediminis]
MASLINIGLTGLKSHQTALATTGNNVTNTNTPGYSRQEVVFESTDSQLTGAGYVGSGVSISTVRRLNEEFLNTQLRSDTTVFSEQEALLSLSGQIDNLLASETTGLSSSMSNFFKALQGGAGDPSSIPERQLLLSQSESLVSRFHQLYSRLQQQSETLDQQLSASVSEINSLSSGIAELNEAITIATGAGQGSEPNSLMDERDELLRQLSEKVTVSVIPQGDNQVNVFIGKGQPLVINNSFNQLGVVESKSNPTESDIAYIGVGGTQVITDDITGGNVGGALAFRDSILKDAINNMGLIAVVLADTINQQHQLGMDLENNLGESFFVDINDPALMSSRVIGHQDNLLPMDRVVGVEIVDAAKLTTNNYELQFGGPSNLDYRVVNNQSGAVVTQGVLPGFFPASIEIEGIAINLESGSFQVGDKFLIQPTRYGARDFAMSVDRVEDIAFASPIRTDASLGNTGSGVISPGVMLDVTDPATNQPLSTFAVPGQISPPMLVRFTSPTVYDVLDASDPANLKPLVPPLNNQKYIPGLSNSLFTEDSGQTVASARGDAFALQGGVVSPLPVVPIPAGSLPDNGYIGQNLTVFSRDPDTGVVTSEAAAITSNASASEIAATLNKLQGLEANAYTHIEISNFTDNGTAPPLEFNLYYEDGGVSQVLNVPSPDALDPNLIAEAINSDLTLAALGYRAVSDGNKVTLTNSNGLDIVVGAGGGAGDSFDVDKINPYDATGSSLSSQTVSGNNLVAVGGYIDVTMSEGVTLIAQSNTIFQQAPPAQSSYRGFQIDIKGEVGVGDVFSIGYNTDGFSDNRNALAIVGLETTGTVSGGVSTYNEAYSKLVEEVGTFTNQVRLDTEASQALLSASTASWNEVSGVNLDEEAGKLIQYQAAYNASAQVISVARELFDTLLGVF